MRGLQVGGHFPLFKRAISSSSFVHLWRFSERNIADFFVCRRERSTSGTSVTRKVEAAMETSSQQNTADKKSRSKVIQIVYIITALDITWMFLQFSITPVSISNMSQREAEISVQALNAESRADLFVN